MLTATNVIKAAGVRARTERQYLGRQFTTFCNYAEICPARIVTFLQGPSATIAVGTGLTFNNAARATTSDISSCKVSRSAL